MPIPARAVPLDPLERGIGVNFIAVWSMSVIRTLKFIVERHFELDVNTLLLLRSWMTSLGFARAVPQDAIRRFRLRP